MNKLKRHKTIAFKWMTVQVISFLLILIVVGIFQYRAVKRDVYKEVELTGRLAGQVFREFLAEHNHSLDKELLSSLLFRLASKIGYITTIEIINPSGMIIADSDMDKIGNISDDSHIELFNEYGEAIEHQKNREDHHLHMAMSLEGPYDETRRSNIIGVIHFNLELARADAKILKNFSQSILLMALFLTGLWAAGYIIISRLVTKRLGDIMDASYRFGRGEYSVRTPVSSSDEITEVALTLNNMADALQKSSDAMLTTYAKVESKVKERTRELTNAYKSLKTENEVRKETEEKLRNALIAAETASKVKSDFLANMSHELTTPLNAVIGFSEVLKDGLYGELNTHQQEYVDNILQGGIRLLSLIKNMLNLVRADSGEDEMRVNRFLLKDALKSAASIFNEKAVTRRLKLTIEIEPDADIEIETDTGKLSQILHNLIDNAVKFTQDGGSVHVQARRGIRGQGSGFCKEELIPNPQPPTPDKDFIEISVADTGIGIQPENIDKLFQPFSQLESPYTKKHGGTGIGLILTKKLIKQLGGRVWAESEYGKGSIFTFAIPIIRG